jgi:hypothetical protein
MNDSYTNELKKLYDDAKVCSLLQEVCEYYATRSGYEDNSLEDEIEPREIVEPVYMLFLLQQREQILDELNYICKRYPNLFSAIKPLYDDILVHMDVRPLESENAHRLSVAMDGKVASAQIYDEIERICSRCENLSEAVDEFYGWLHRF